MKKLVVITNPTLFQEHIWSAKDSNHFTLSVYWGEGIIKIELNIELVIKTICVVLAR
jgi:hypothetical protein